jgi:hypothetical protein
MQLYNGHNTLLYNGQNTLFDIVNYITMFLLIISYVGAWKLAPSYAMTIRTGMQFYIAVFLIVRFNPYTKRCRFGELDRKVSYSAGIFLLLASSITRYFLYMSTRIIQLPTHVITLPTL